MGVAVVAMQSSCFHQGRGRALRSGAALIGGCRRSLDEGSDLVERLVDSALTLAPRPDHRALGPAPAQFSGFRLCVCTPGRIQRQAQRARIGQADVPGRHADEPAREVARVGAAVEHMRTNQYSAASGKSEPQHAFVQRVKVSSELLAALLS